MNRNEFLKMLGLGAIASYIPINIPARGVVKKDNGAGVIGAGVIISHKGKPLYCDGVINLSDVYTDSMDDVDWI